jgi:hypothetical protein
MCLSFLPGKMRFPDVLSWKWWNPISSYLKSTLGFAMMGSQILSRRVGYNSCGFGPHGDAPWYPNLLRRVKQIKIQLMLKLMRTDTVLQESYIWIQASISSEGKGKKTHSELTWFTCIRSDQLHKMMLTGRINWVRWCSNG